MEKANTYYMGGLYTDQSLLFFGPSPSIVSSTFRVDSWVTWNDWRPSLEVRMVPNPLRGTIGAGQQASQTRESRVHVLCSFSFRLPESDGVKLGERLLSLGHSSPSQLSTRNDPIHSLAFAISRTIVFTSSVNFEWRASHLKKAAYAQVRRLKKLLKWEKQNPS